MKTYFSSGFKLGILGGGQLGKMFLNETRKYDIYTCVLDASLESPCRIACNEFFQGDILDFDTVYAFGKKVNLLTIEIEHVNIEALLQLEQEGLEIHPSPQLLKIIQNKGDQKDFYRQHHIPTAPYRRFPNSIGLKKAVASNSITVPFVWKSERFGYDGTGVRIIKDKKDLEEIPDVACIAEVLIPFKNELSVIVAANQRGDIKTYPVVEMEFHPTAHQVEYTLCPARIPKAIAQKAENTALKLAKSLGNIGLLAVELFHTHEDDILVNEAAPRPHNSGHYSIEAAYTSQFEQHLRAILNLPLGSTANKLSGVMVNLTGAEGYRGNVYYKNIETIMELEGVIPHLYGKKQTHPFRKMGHVCIVNDDLNRAREIAEKVKNTIEVIAY